MNINKTNVLITPSKLSLDNPGRLQGGSYYCKIKYDNQPFYIQTPVVHTKNGIKETSKKTYCDIMFEQTDNFTTYLEDLETHLKQILYEKSKLWFYNDLDEDDIDMFYRPCVRNYKFKYLLMRTYVNKKRGENKDNIQIYDEDEIIRTKDDVLNKSVIAIIKPKGVTFTTTSFSLDIELVQLMIINTGTQFSKCMIKNEVSNEEVSNEEVNNEQIGNEEVSNGEVNDENTVDNNVVETSEELIQEKEDVTSEATLNATLETNLETNLETQEKTSPEKLEETIQEDTKDSVNEQDKNVSSDEKVKQVDYDLQDSGIIVLNHVNTLVNTENETNDTSDSGEIHSNDTKTLENTIEPMKDISLEIDTVHLDKIANDTKIIEEVRLGIEDIDKTNDGNNIKLKDPRDVYYELYEEAYNKARLAKKLALESYLEARQIKNQYLIDDTVTSSDDEDEDDDEDVLDNLSVYSEEELLNTLNAEF